MIEDYWGPSMKMLNDMKFLDNLKNFDKDNIPGPIMKKIREKYISFSQPNISTFFTCLLDTFRIVILSRKKSKPFQRHAKAYANGSVQWMCTIK